MKQRNRWVAVLTVWTIALLFASGFTSQTSVSGSGMVQKEDTEYNAGAGTIAAVLEKIPLEAVEQTKAKAEKAQEERQKAEAEAKRKAEEEAARKVAEEAARAQIAAEDQKLLASIIFCEAGNQPYEGQVAVGAVIMNRVRSGAYPNSISEVIYQSGQFGPAMTGWLDTVRSSGGYTQTAMQAAADAMAGVNPIGDCLYFGNGNYGIQIGDHFFH